MFLLDAYDNVYVWLGQEARQDEKTSAMDTALVSVSVCLSVCLCVCLWLANQFNFYHVKKFSNQARVAAVAASSARVGRCKGRFSTLRSSEQLTDWLCFQSPTPPGSRVASVLDSGAEGPGFKSQPRRCRVTVLANCSHPSCSCSLSSEIGISPLKGCRGNCRPGGK